MLKTETFPQYVAFKKKKKKKGYVMLGYGHCLTESIEEL